MKRLICTKFIELQFSKLRTNLECFGQIYHKPGVLRNILQSSLRLSQTTDVLPFRHASFNFITVDLFGFINLEKGVISMIGWDNKLSLYGLFWGKKRQALLMIKLGLTGIT